MQLRKISSIRTQWITLIRDWPSLKEYVHKKLSTYIRVHEIFADVRNAVFPRDFARWVEIPSFIFLRHWEVVGATLAFLVSRPPDFTAKSRDSEIASTLTPKRTPSFAARWLNSSQKFLLCSKKQQNFRDLKNIASSPRYGDFSERGHKIHRAA